MSLTACTQSPLTTLAFDTQSWDASRPFIREYVLVAALPCALYGIFVLLCGASIYSLVQFNSRNRQTTLVLSLALLALFCSTTLFTVTKFLEALEDVLKQVVYAGLRLWHVDDSYPVDVTGAPRFGLDSAEGFLYSASTATLTINILLGDAIVCWRACTVWRGNRIIIGTSVVLLLTTFALGIVDTQYVYLENAGNNSWQPDPYADADGSLYSGFSYGIAATVLSLSTNLFATLAVAVKAWQARRALKQYVVTGPTALQMEKVFLLLVESGMVYSALWVVVLAWQAGTYFKDILWVAGDNNFWDVFNIILRSALVPLIAIYPTVIIVLVAMNRSHIENGFMKITQNSAYGLPLRPVTVAVTALTTHHERSGRMLVIGGDEFSSGDGAVALDTINCEMFHQDELNEDIQVPSRLFREVSERVLITGGEDFQLRYSPTGPSAHTTGEKIFEDA